MCAPVRVIADPMVVSDFPAADADDGMLSLHRRTVIRPKARKPIDSALLASTWSHTEHIKPPVWCLVSYECSEQRLQVFWQFSVPQGFIHSNSSDGKREGQSQALQCETYPRRWMKTSVGT